MNKNIKYLSWALAAALSLVLSGCATVFSGTKQNVSIRAVDSATGEPISGVRIMVTDASGSSRQLAGNPGVLSVARDGAISITCSKEGYRQGNTWVGDSFNAVTLVNVLWWPGFFVDQFSGANRELPSCYSVAMEKIEQPTVVQAAAPVMASASPATTDTSKGA